MSYHFIYFSNSIFIFVFFLENFFFCVFSFLVIVFYYLHIIFYLLFQVYRYHDVDQTDHPSDCGIGFNNSFEEDHIHTHHTHDINIRDNIIDSQQTPSISRRLISDDTPTQYVELLVVNDPVKSVCLQFVYPCVKVYNFSKKS